MKQVAALAGVGTKTVSRVVNMEPNVSAEMEARVREAIIALDFHADARARSLRRSDRRTKSVGLLVSNVENPFAGEVHRGVEEIARARDVVVLASSLDEDPIREKAAVDDLIARHVDGILLETTTSDISYLAPTLRRGLPIVFIDRCPSGAAVDCVTSDNREGAAAATRHLIERGHRRIAMLTERADIPTSVERYRGFLEEFGRAGIPTGEAVSIHGLGSAADAEKAVRDLLSTAPEVTAIVSGQNTISVGALHALKAMGLQRTIAFVGFDDLPLADLMEPGVTVIQQDAREIGRAAAIQLFRRLDGDDSAPLRQVVATRLIERGSGEIAPSSPARPRQPAATDPGGLDSHP